MSAETAEASYRAMMIDKLASKLQMAVITAVGDPWTACAEAAVDELIDRPEREFQRQLAAVVARNEETDSMGAWVPAKAEAWL